MGQLRRTKQVTLLPTIQNWVFVVSFRQFEQAQLCMGFGKGEALFPPSKTVKFQKVYISHGLFLLCVGFRRLYCWAGSAWHSGQTVYHHFVWRCGPFSGGTLSNSRAVRFCYFNTCTGDLLHIKCIVTPSQATLIFCLFVCTYVSIRSPKQTRRAAHKLNFCFGTIK